MSQAHKETTVEEITRLMAQNAPASKPAPAPAKESVLNTPDEVKHGIAINALVRLKAGIRKPKCPAGREDNETATVNRYMPRFNEPDLDNYPVMLNSDLHGDRMWNIKDLELA